MNLVVTVPKWFWPQWIAEGDPAGTPESGTEWAFFLGGKKPPISHGDRLYIVAHDRLRGYAPVTRLSFEAGRWAICRRGRAVACTIHWRIPGFRGFRHVWWKPDDEYPFPAWRTP